MRNCFRSFDQLQALKKKIHLQFYPHTKKKKKTIKLRKHTSNINLTPKKHGNNYCCMFTAPIVLACSGNLFQSTNSRKNSLTCKETEY